MEMNLAIRAFEGLLGLSVALQSVEYLRIIQLDRVNDWAILRNEIPDRPRWVRPLLDRLLAPRAYRVLLSLRLALSLALMAGVMSGAAGLLGATVLFGMALVLLLRWRGAFNGGSDFMTLVGLTGLLIAHGVGALTTPELGWRAGLWYVTLQSVTSYFVSPVVAHRAGVAAVFGHRRPRPAAFRQRVSPPGSGTHCQLVIHGVGRADATGPARPAPGHGAVRGGGWLSLFGVPILRLEPVLLGLAGHLPGHRLLRGSPAALTARFRRGALAAMDCVFSAR